MAARAGEKAQESGTFHCAKCNETVRVTKGHEIPKCPNCGNETFDERTHETTSSRR